MCPSSPSQDEGPSHTRFMAFKEQLSHTVTIPASDVGLEMCSPPN